MRDYLDSSSTSSIHDVPLSWLLLSSAGEQDTSSTLLIARSSFHKHSVASWCYLLELRGTTG